MDSMDSRKISCPTGWRSEKIEPTLPTQAILTDSEELAGSYGRPLGEKRTPRCLSLHRHGVLSILSKAYFPEAQFCPRLDMRFGCQPHKFAAFRPAVLTHRSAIQALYQPWGAPRNERFH